MVKFIPVDENEFNEYMETAIKNYAEEKVKAGNWPDDGALERSVKEFKSLLPEGKDTESNHVYKILDTEKNEDVGNLWIAVFKDGDVKGAYIYDIVVDEVNRGMGYGRETMEELENVVRDLGCDRISLQVFGHNKVAFSLYDSCGYEVTNIVMSKKI